MKQVYTYFWSMLPEGDLFRLPCFGRWKIELPQNSATSSNHLITDSSTRYQFSVRLADCIYPEKNSTTHTSRRRGEPSEKALQWNSPFRTFWVFRERLLVASFLRSISGVSAKVFLCRSYLHLCSQFLSMGSAIGTFSVACLSRVLTNGVIFLWSMMRDKILVLWG